MASPFAPSSDSSDYRRGRIATDPGCEMNVHSGPGIKTGASDISVTVRPRPPWVRGGTSLRYPATMHQCGRYLESNSVTLEGNPASFGKGRCFHRILSKLDDCSGNLLNVAVSPRDKANEYHRPLGMLSIRQEFDQADPRETLGLRRSGSMEPDRGLPRHFLCVYHCLDA